MVLRKLGWCELVVSLAKCCGAKMKRSPYIEVRGGRSVVTRLEWAGRNTHMEDIVSQEHHTRHMQEACLPTRGHPP